MPLCPCRKQEGNSKSLGSGDWRVEVMQGRSLERGHQAFVPSYCLTVPRSSMLLVSES